MVDEGIARRKPVGDGFAECLERIRANKERERKEAEEGKKGEEKEQTDINKT